MRIAAALVATIAIASRSQERAHLDDEKRPPAESAPSGAKIAKPAQAKASKTKGKRGPAPDPFRFLDFQDDLRGQGLQEIRLHLEGGLWTFEVRSMGQWHRETGTADPALKAEMAMLLRSTEAWPKDASGRGCLAFGDGPVTREARLGPHADDPMLALLVTVIRVEAMELAYEGELARYATDEPSLAAGTIAMLVADARAGRVAMSARLLSLLNQIALDRTVRTLVRDAATSALAAFGRTPAPDAHPASADAEPLKPRTPKPAAAPESKPSSEEPMSD